VTAKDTVNAGRRAGFALGACLIAFAVLGPFLTPNDPSTQFAESVYAQPMRPHVVDAGGRVRWPFVYPLELESRLEHQYAEDRTRPMPIRLFANGAILSVDPAHGSPWFPLGADALGRDQLARLAVGARLSLGVALGAALGALLVGAVLGGAAGFAGGALDDGLMRLADVMTALPALYVVLALRASMPLVLSAGEVFSTMIVVLALVGWPWPARGVRAVVAAERSREYAEAARALGAGSTRILLRHLLPAARGFLVVQATLLVPAFVLAEATLSFVGLGFGEPIPSWGTMLRDAAQGRAVVEAPWLLTPAAGIVCAALAVNLAFEPAAPLRAPTRTGSR
jgi:peptide/nickel transport system permease protein